MLVGAVPDLAINLLSRSPHRQTVFYQYTAGIIPFVVAASILGAARLRRGRRAPALLLVGGKLLRPGEPTGLHVRQRSPAQQQRNRGNPRGAEIDTARRAGFGVADTRRLRVDAPISCAVPVCREDIVGNRGRERSKRIHRRLVAPCVISARAAPGRACSTLPELRCSSEEGKTTAPLPTRWFRQLKAKLDSPRLRLVWLPPSRQLDRNFRTPVPSHPPGRDVIGDGENVADRDRRRLTSNRNRIRNCARSTRAKQDALADAKLRSADQAAQPSKRGVCNLASFQTSDPFSSVIVRPADTDTASQANWTLGQLTTGSSLLTTRYVAKSDTEEREPMATVVWAVLIIALFGAAAYFATRGRRG